jgi:hypothetical protein
MPIWPSTVSDPLGTTSTHPIDKSELRKTQSNGKENNRSMRVSFTHRSSEPPVADIELTTINLMPPTVPLHVSASTGSSMSKNDYDDDESATLIRHTSGTNNVTFINPNFYAHASGGLEFASSLGNVVLGN